MTQARSLRVRIATAVVAALLAVSVVSHVLPNATWFGGVAYAGECSNSTCG